MAVAESVMTAFAASGRVMLHEAYALGAEPRTACGRTASSKANRRVKVIGCP